MKMPTPVKLKLSQQSLLLVGLPLLFMLMFTATLTVLQKQAEEEIRKERHSKAIVNECNVFLKHAADAGLFLYMYQTTRREDFLAQYDQLKVRAMEELRNLELLLRDSPDSTESMKRLREVANHGETFLQDARQFVTDNSLEQGAATQVKLASIFLENIQAFRSFINDQEKQQTFSMKEDMQTRLMILWFLGFGLVFSCVMAIALAVYFNAAATKRFAILLDNTMRFKNNKQLNEVLEGADEIAVVDSSFHEMVKALKEASDKKQEILAMVSHDLRTPLTALEMTFELFSDGTMGELNEKGSKAARRTRHILKNMIGLINDLLDFEKLEAGHLEMEKKEMAIEEIFDRVIETLQVISSEKEIEIVSDAQEQVAFVDPDRIAQVLINLSGNALKFSPRKSTITLSARAIPEGVEFRVQDEGRGIPADKLPYVFERFYQVEKTDGVSGKGTGLGLAICKGFVEAHGGKIGVESQTPGGTCFWFTIPSLSQP